MAINQIINEFIYGLIPISRLNRSLKKRMPILNSYWWALMCGVTDNSIDTNLSEAAGRVREAAGRDRPGGDVP